MGMDFLQRWSFLSFFMHSFARVCIILLTIGLISWGLYQFFEEHAAAHQCEERLRQIYKALEQYEIERGVLPHAAFFPDDPKQDSDSLITALAAYVAGNEVYICPAAALLIKETGLTYVWNVDLNGKKLRDSNDAVWMLTEINALSDQVPPPHWWRYHILYTDGTIHHSRTPPEGL
jgi:hypothetical protein